MSKELENVEIIRTPSSNSKTHWGEYTDCVISIKQGSNVVVMTQRDLKKLERVIGAKFKV